MLLHAAFDGGVDAEFAAGDAKLYTAPTGDRANAQPGLPEGKLVLLAKGKGRHGDALRFTKKMTPVVFFRGEKNLGYNPRNWSGSASLWLRLDPDKDLESGYCDPLQFVAQNWGEGNMFIEFSKDHTPRHFRYAILALPVIGTPQTWAGKRSRNRSAPWSPSTNRDSRMISGRTSSSRLRNVNSGKKDGWGKLYLNGEIQGEFTGWENTFTWDLTQSAVTPGLSYIGWLDDLGLFTRPLTEAEIKTIYAAPPGPPRIDEVRRSFAAAR